MKKRNKKRWLTGLLCIVLFCSNVIPMKIQASAAELGNDILITDENTNERADSNDINMSQNDETKPSEEDTDEEKEGQEDETEKPEGEESGEKTGEADKIESSEEVIDAVEPSEKTEMTDKDNAELEEEETDDEDESEIKNRDKDNVALNTMETITGQCGDNITWTLEENTLTITGNGVIEDYDENSQPWHTYIDDIKILIIHDGITGIGEMAFFNCYNLTGELVLPDSLTEIGVSAFENCYGFEGDLIIPDNVIAIGEKAFEGCNKLSGVAYIPKSVISIGENALSSIHTIYGESDSYAETYAINNNITFIETNLVETYSNEIRTGNISIETADELFEVSQNVSQGISNYEGCVIQINKDIDLSGVTWSPIGNTREHPFCGSIQGNGYKISGITCNEGVSGLIGYWQVQNECYVDNITIDNMKLTGKYSGGIAATVSIGDKGKITVKDIIIDGGIDGTSLIAGGAFGEINISGNGRTEVSGCNINVSINSSARWDDAYAAIGGIIGRACDDGNGEFVIQNCSVDGDLATHQRYGYCSSEAGGLIGLAQINSIKIELCSKTGSVSCEAYYAHTGGFIGNANIAGTRSLEINNCYVNADILPNCTNGTSCGGGLIGHTSGAGGSQIKIFNTYVTGSLSADQYAGAGFVCWHEGGECPIVKNCYFDMNKLGLAKDYMVCELRTFTTTWLNNNISNSGGLTTADMKLQSSYEGWDFENIWSILPDENNGYPVLRKNGGAGIIQDYSSYELKVYSQFKSCTVGVNQEFSLRPVMAKGEEALKNEVGYSFIIEDTDIIEISGTQYDVYGPIIMLKGKSAGNTTLKITHVASGKDITINLSVVDEFKVYNLSDLESLPDGYGIFNAQILVDSFKSTKNGKGYDITFDAYNGFFHAGAVEVYNKDGKIIQIEKIGKFERYETGLKDAWDSGCNLVVSAFNGSLGSFKNSLYSQKTSIKIWVPRDGYFVISNNVSQSLSAWAFNTVDLGFFVYKTASNPNSGPDGKWDKVTVDGQKVIKEYIVQKLTYENQKKIVEQIQNKVMKTLGKKVGTATATNMMASFLDDADGVWKDLDINLEKIFLDTAWASGLSITQTAIEDLGGTAGIILHKIFTVNQYLNRYMQFVDMCSTIDASEVKIYINDEGNSLISNGVIVQSKDGDSLSNNKLIVTNITKKDSSRYIIEKFNGTGKIRIMDITMYRDNQEIQPNGIIRIKIPLPIGYSQTNSGVYRMETDGMFTNMNAIYDDGYMVFETDHLSTYILVDNSMDNNETNNSNTDTNDWIISNNVDLSEGVGTGMNVETWQPATPDEKKRYACVGSEAVQYTLDKDNLYHLIIEKAMQGPLCFNSFEAVLNDYTIGRTYNIYPYPDKVYSLDKEVQFTIKIPKAIYKPDRNYKMICVTKNGLPIVYEDLDKNPETITVRTNKFYAYALIYKDLD